jgi:FkbM family methyltransferase
VKNRARALIESSLRVIGRSQFGSRLNQMAADSMMANLHAIEHDGTRLSFVVPNFVNRWRVDSFSSKEPETLEWIDSIPKGSVVWDIGANVGLYSCYAAKRGDCTVYAFEPSVFNLELLARNIFINDLSEKVTIVPLPLSSGISTSTLNMSTTQWGGAMSTFNESYTHDGSALKKVFEFRTVGLSMDDAVERLGLPRPDFVKMDVDGIEHLILRGGPRTLAGVRGVLVEINEEFEMQTSDSRKYLIDAGLTLKEKRHADSFEDTIFRNCYNQVWHRAMPTID